ncbi:TM2 domain-containing protein [Actinomyces culturomici]|uniref:TM2 domain-containing protein n=1 Tax=Actinomyces culturomici TaxID=1926276 RepID=UPI000E207255|nr:TM2 domain-containing protein [Actinomyces culturomici]
MTIPIPQNPDPENVGIPEQPQRPTQPNPYAPSADASSPAEDGPTWAPYGSAAPEQSDPSTPYAQQNPYAQPTSSSQGGTAQSQQNPYAQPGFTYGDQAQAAPQYQQQPYGAQNPYDQGAYGAQQGAWQPYGQDSASQGYAEQQYAQQQYAQQQYGQPGYAYAGQAGYAPKSKIIAGILGIILGAFGVHNFYLGRTTRAVVQLVISLVSFGSLSFIPAIWGLVEGILILISQPGTEWHRDGRGIELTD